jgi:single-strand DNA-binding protein
MLLSGCGVCRIRIAVNGVRRNAMTGDWDERAKFFDVTIFGAQADQAKQVLHRGRSVTVEGRLEWREWESPDGEFGEITSVVAEQVLFVESTPGGDEDSGTPFKLSLCV